MMKIMYQVAEVGYEYNDEVYERHGSQAGGKVYADKKEADDRCRELDLAAARNAYELAAFVGYEGTKEIEAAMEEVLVGTPFEEDWPAVQELPDHLLEKVLDTVDLRFFEVVCVEVED